MAAPTTASTSTRTNNIRQKWATKLQLPTPLNALNFGDSRFQSSCLAGLYIHARQCCQIAHALQNRLANGQATETHTHVKPHDYALLEAIRYLRYFYDVSRTVLCTGFRTQDFTPQLLNTVRAMLNGILIEASSLEQHLHPSLLQRTRGPYKTIPLESLLELSIQCVLDFLQDSSRRELLFYAWEEVQKTFGECDLDSYSIYNDLARRAGSPGMRPFSKIPRGGSRFGLPAVIFLAGFDNTIHVGGSKMRFKLEVPKPGNPTPFNWMDRTVYQDYHANRNEVLSVLDGASKLVELGRDSQQYVDGGGSFGQLEIQELVDTHRGDATCVGIEGQAYFGFNFDPRGPCAKCRIIHQFKNSQLTDKLPFDNQRYPDLACAEDLWYIKMKMAKMVHEEAAGEAEISGSAE